MNLRSETASSTDRVAAALTGLFAGSALIVAFAAYAYLIRGQLWPGASFVVVALVFALFGGIWWARRGALITGDEDGLTRDGRFGWHLEWSVVEGAAFQKVSSVVGSQDCVILQISEGAMAGRLAASTSSSRTFRWSLPVGHNVLVVPLDTADSKALVEYILARVPASQ